MPTYEYQCQSCQQRVEAVQKFSDPALTKCELCGGELRKVFSAVGIVFKGSGFYKNDSRGTTKSTTAAPANTPLSTGSDSGSAPSTPATTSTPAATTPAASTPAATIN